jgi:peptidoglycan/xylan/chitin deacetylase (PgdA/CDA1 family)/GT2 family glycosyltransferase
LSTGSQPTGSTATVLGDTASRPELTVVVTTRNRSELLRLCLDSLDRQTAPPETYEVVVVVDGSTDGTMEMLRRREPRCALTVLEQPRAGASAGRNAGAARARGRFLLFVDDDEVADPGLVSAHLEARRDRSETVVIGAIARRVPERADRYARLGVTDATWQIEQLESRPPTYWDCFGGNCSVARDAFLAVGGYAVDLKRETDTELAFRLHAAGHGFVFARSAVVTEYRTRRWKGIIDDAEDRGRIAVDLYRRHPEMLPQMPLGGHGELSRPRLRRAFENVALAFRLPPVLLGALGFALPRHGWTKAWFAFVRSHAYWSGVRTASDRELWRRARSATLILGYHAFGADGEQPSRFVVPASRFAHQLSWLERRRYNVITLGEYVSYRKNYRLPPPKTVVITIDDGYVDTATVAGPLLERHGVRATLFAVASLPSGKAVTSDPALARRALLDPSALPGLSGTFEIGSHTETHPRLTGLPPGEAASEIISSKRALESALGKPVSLFAYPFGAANGEVRRLVEEAGYVAARGTRPGRNRPATPTFDLRWLEICGTYTLPRFVATLLLGDLRR